MGFSVVKNSFDANGYIKENVQEILMDSVDDYDSLPEDASPGSIAYIADGSAIYLMNNAGVWVEFGG